MNIGNQENLVDSTKGSTPSKLNHNSSQDESLSMWTANQSHDPEDADCATDISKGQEETLETSVSRTSAEMEEEGSISEVEGSISILLDSIEIPDSIENGENDSENECIGSKIDHDMENECSKNDCISNDHDLENNEKVFVNESNSMEPKDNPETVTAASSRVFFLGKQEKAKEMAAAAIKMPLTPKQFINPTRHEMIHSKESIEEVLTIASGISSDLLSNREFLSVIMSPQKAAQSLQGSVSLFEVLSNKIEAASALLVGPTKTDWRATRKCEADSQPLVLLDKLLDMASFVVCTSGAWSFEVAEGAALASLMEDLTARTMECTKRLNRRRELEPEVASTLCALESLMGPLLRDIRSGIALSTNLIDRTQGINNKFNGIFPHSVAAVVCGTNVVNDSIKFLSSVASFEGAASEVSQIFPDSTKVLQTMEALKASIHSLAEQRTSDWHLRGAASALYHSPSENGLIPNTPVCSSNSSIMGQTPNAATAAIEAKLERDVFELAAAIRVVVRSAGNVLGGIYRDIGIQEELITGICLAVYVDIIGSSFYSSLLALQSHVPSHILSSVRRSLKSQCLPVNQNASCTQNVATASASGGQAVPCANEHQSVGQQAVVSLFSNPSAFSLTRQSESNAVFKLLVPQSKKAMAPADRSNGILMLFAWENGFSNFLSLMGSDWQEKEFAQTDVSEIQLAEAILADVTNGAKALVHKFSRAIELFDLSGDIWTNRGEDILNLANRIGEAVSLRYLGEVPLSAKKQEGPRWSRNIFEKYALRVVPDRSSQIVSKIVEGLPKFVCEVLHQSLYYRCPLRCLECEGLSAASQNLANTVAIASRSVGQIADINSQLIKTHQVASNAAQNNLFLNQNQLKLAAEVNDLSNRVQTQSDGVIDRHSQQIRTQTNRLEEHTVELRKQKGILTTDHTILGNHTVELKKIGDNISGLSGIIDSKINEGLEKLKIAQQDKLEDAGRDLDILRNNIEEFTTQELQALELRITRKIDEDVGVLRESVEKAQALYRRSTAQLCESVVTRCRKDVSLYLSQQLSEYVDKAVNDKVETLSKKRRFVWTNNSPASLLRREVKNQITPEADGNAEKRSSMPPLITRNLDDLTSVADTSSVMDEAAFDAESSWMPEGHTLLDLYTK